VRTKRLFHRHRKPGPAERERTKRVEEAWQAERRHAGEEWALELEQRRIAALTETSGESARSTPPTWAELELIRRREKAPKRP
jgi:hypothetical protein